MDRLEIREPTEEDILELIENMSIEDRREILSQGISIEWGVRHTIETSTEAVAFRWDGKLAAITGLCVHGILIESYFPWLLGTPEMQKHPRKVLSFSRQILARWRAKHPYMVNYVDARHHRAISWLTHLGAKFEFIEKHGAYQRPFYKFSFGDEQCA